MRSPETRSSPTLKRKRNLKEMKGMNVLESIKKRKSVRVYLDTPVEDDKLLGKFYYALGWELNVVTTTLHNG